MLNPIEKFESSMLHLNRDGNHCSKFNTSMREWSFTTGRGDWEILAIIPEQ